MVRANRAACAMVGSDPCGRSLTELGGLMGLDDPGLLAREASRRRPSRVGVVTTQDRRPVHLDLRLSALGSDHTIVMTIIDNTPQKTREGDWRSRCRELGRRSQRVAASELASRLDRDLRQPLMAMQVYIDGCLQMARSGRDAGEISGVLEQLREDLARAAVIPLRVVDGALGDRPPPGSADIARIAEGVFELFEEDFVLGGIQASLALEDPLPRVHIPPRLVEVALWNLVCDALDSLHGLADRRLTIGAQRWPRHVTLFVRDSGPPPGEAASNARIGAPSSPAREVDGLGRAVARAIAENHHGSLRVVIEGGGTKRLVLKLPVMPRPPSASR